MADKNQFSSANQDISIAGAKKTQASMNPKAMLAGMSKDVRKRWIAVFTLTAVALSLTTAWVSSDGAPKPQPIPENPVIDTTPKGLSNQTDWKTQTGAELLQLKRDLAASQDSQREILLRLEAMKSAQEAAAKAQPTPQAGLSDLTLPPPPTPPKSLSLPPIPPKDLAASPSADKGMAPPAAVEPKRTAAKAFIPTSSTAKAVEAELEPEELVANDKQGFLPAGSFSAATLISGVEAFTGGTAQSQPQPVVVRIDTNAVLPNAANYQIKGCHVLASVWGDMSSERVFGRLATLTCVDASNKLVLSEEVEGTLVDSDGKNGIRGQLVDRQGAKLARSLLAGFAQGVASAFGTAQSTVTTSALGTTSALTGDAFKAAGYGGANNAAQQLASFYLKQAEATMPVIAVDAGRKMSVLFTKSKSLRFESTSQYRVSRKDKLTVERSN